MHAVSHDDHPGNAGYPSILHLLIRVAVSSMRVTVSVRVLLGFTSILLGGGLTEVCGCQRRLVGGRVGRLELGELRVVVAVVAGDSCAVRVWQREEMLTGGPKELKLATCCKDSRTNTNLH